MVKHTQYDVEKVLAKRITPQGTEYFVAWSKFGSYKNAWIVELPDFFEEEWGAASDKPFLPYNIFQDMVDLACKVLAE